MQLIKKIFPRIAVYLLFAYWVVFISLSDFFGRLARSIENFIAHCAMSSAEQHQREQAKEAEIDRIREKLEKLL